MYSVGLNEHEHFARGERQKIWNGGGWKSWIHWAQHKCWSKDGGDKLFRLLLAFDESSHGCIYWVETVTSVRNGSDTASNTMHLLVWGVCCSLTVTLRPVAFASRTMGPSERYHFQLDKAALPIIFGMKLSLSRLPSSIDEPYPQGDILLYEEFDRLRVDAAHVQKKSKSDPIISHTYIRWLLHGWRNRIDNEYESFAPYMKNAEMKCSSIRTAIYEAADWSFRIQSHPTFRNCYMPIIRPWPLWKNRPEELRLVA